MTERLSARGTRSEARRKKKGTRVPSARRVTVRVRTLS
jgi:hypothetical protein